MTNELNKIRAFTNARVALNHVGSAIPTQAILKFNADRASAQDAVHAVWDVDRTKNSLENSGEQVIQVASAVTSREHYLKRPDLGRLLNEESRNQLKAMNTGCDVVFIFSDGLSATAIEKHAVPFWSHFKKALSAHNLIMAPLVLAPFSRVALSDEIGFYLNATVSIIIIGERPGLSAYDSLGIYLTFGPKPGNMDSARNCISNIHPPDGLSYAEGANKLLYLLLECMKHQLSGVGLNRFLS